MPYEDLTSFSLFQEGKSLWPLKKKKMIVLYEAKNKS